SLVTDVSVGPSPLGRTVTEVDACDACHDGGAEKENPSPVTRVPLAASVVFGPPPPPPQPASTATSARMASSGRFRGGWRGYTRDSRESDRKDERSMPKTKDRVSG